MSPTPDLCDQIDDAFIHEDEALAMERRRILSVCRETEDGEHVFGRAGFCLHCDQEEPE